MCLLAFSLNENFGCCSHPIEMFFKERKENFSKKKLRFHVLQVKARATTREVMATYSIEDIVIELIIQLPSNYPLGSITVESGKRVGVAVQQWRNWMLQLSTYLTHQVRVCTPRRPHRGSC